MPRRHRPSRSSRGKTSNAGGSTTVAELMSKLSANLLSFNDQCHRQPDRLSFQPIAAARPVHGQPARHRGWIDPRSHQRPARGELCVRRWRGRRELDPHRRHRPRGDPEGWRLGDLRHGCDRRRRQFHSAQGFLGRRRVRIRLSDQLRAAAISTRRRSAPAWATSQKIDSMSSAP